MPRTDQESVRALIEVSIDTDLMPYIQMATDITDIIVRRDTGSLMTLNLLKHVESLLAAHYYAHLDPQYQSKKAGDAAESYLPRNWWKEAEKLDLTGTLAVMYAGNQSAKLSYLGTRPKLQRNSWNRP